MTNGTRKGWGISVTPQPLFTPGKDPVPIVQDVGWAPGPVWTGAENLAPYGFRSPDRPACSQSLYWLRYTAQVGLGGRWIFYHFIISEYNKIIQYILKRVFLFMWLQVVVIIKGVLILFRFVIECYMFRLNEPLWGITKFCIVMADYVSLRRNKNFYCVIWWWFFCRNTQHWVTNMQVLCFSVTLHLRAKANWLLLESH
jgi:hypothetical protein